ncbi:SDR family NAD(P)-dependent oxidoreductase [Virgibacillus sp. Bac330]|uniref:SDR family NAD(P)-dependent oxidoreductase n=1 Tax=Virgibacillus sp. Bac330 TaxID=2419841 RepID=UPI000EF43DC6|nr:SDR family NAD(P)-dependent oxidoreductase [Virgibacillus sp. Bac330]
MKKIYDEANVKVEQAYVSGGDIKMHDPNSLTLVKTFEENLKQNGEESVYFYNVKGQVSSTNYNEIKINSLKMLNGLSRRKVHPQEKVIFQCGTPKDFIHMFWASMYGGIIPILANLPKDLDDITDINSITILNIWKMTDKSKIVVSDEIYDQYVRFAEKIGIDVNCLINIDTLDGSITETNIYETQPEDTAMMFFTSGSTGVPKGVLQTHKAAVLREFGQIQLNNSQKDVLLNWMPLEHAGGVLMGHVRGVMLGSTQVLVETEYILSNPLRWLDLIDKYRVNSSWAPHFAFVLIEEMIEHTPGEWNLSCVNSLINSGEMVHAKSAKSFLKSLKIYGLKSDVMHPVWGMSETCSGVLYNLEFDEKEFSGVQLVSKNLNEHVITNSVENANVVTEIGMPIPGCSIKIVDQNNKTLPKETIGRVLIKGEPVTQGYFKNKEANKESFTEDGWFITGDLGFIRNDKVTLTGREKDVIIVNGLNYNNVEVEAIIEEDRRVEKSFTAVCAVTDPDKQLEKVIAFIVPQNDDQDKEKLINEIKNHVLVRLNLKIDHIIPVKKDDIPKTNLEKIQRSKLGQLYIDGKFANHEILTDVINQLDRVKTEVSEKFDISDVAIVLNESNRKLDALIISDQADLARTGIISEEYKENQNLSKQMNQTLTDIEGVQKLYLIWKVNSIGMDSFEPIIFFKTGLKDFHFNILVLKKIQEQVVNKFNYKQSTIIPISCITYLETSSLTELVDAYKQGLFRDLLTKIDKELLNANTLPQWFYEEKLVPCNAIEENRTNNFRVILVNDVELMTQLIDVYRHQLRQIVFLIDENSNYNQTNEYLNIEYINVYDKNSYESALKKWCENQEQIDIVHLTGCEIYEIGSIESLEDAQYKTVVSIQNVIQTLGMINVAIDRFLVMTKNTLAIENINHNYAISTVSGFVKSAADEGHKIKHIDIDDASAGLLTEIIKTELNTIDKLKQVVYRENKRHKLSVQNLDIYESIENETSLVENGFYLITGGLGGIGVNIAETLMDHFRAKIVLTGRTNIVEDINSEKYKAYDDLKVLEKNGSKIFYEPCNLTNDKEVNHIIEHYENKFGKTLNGIIHLAGGITEQLVENQDIEELLAVYDAKVYGTYVLAKVIEDRKDAIYVTTSTARSLLPGMTVSAYCSASEFNAHLSRYMNEQLNIPTYCISWSQWDEIGMGKDLVVKDVLEEKGFKNILKEQGQNSFLMTLKFKKPYVYVGLDQTKKSMRELLLDNENPQQEIQVFTTYRNVLNKEEEFISFIKKSIDRLEEFNGVTINFRFVNHLPLDKNGLVDKTLLSDRMDVLLGATKIINPRNEYEQKVYDAWKKVLKNIDFGVTDHFFNLGGDSIKIIQLISILKSAFNVPIKNQDIFKLITIEQQAKFFKNQYKTNQQQVPTNTSIKISNEESVVKGNIEILSAPQKRQWVLYKMNPDSPYYNNTVAINISGTILLPCLKMAIYQLVERHESLRTRFGEKNDQFCQFIDDSFNLSIEEVNLAEMNEVEQADALEKLYIEEANKVIHIDQEIPIRATIITIGSNETILLISIHHIASDGWSMGVLLQDLSAIYSDILTTGRSKLPVLTMQYSNFATWQHQFMKSPEYEKQLQYWKEELKDAPPTLELPLDLKRTGEIQNKGKRLIFEIDQEVTSKLKAICKEKNCTLYMLLMSAFSSLMHRYSNQEDMIIGTLIANRNQAELEEMIGFFVNSMPIRLNVKSDMSFDLLIEQVKDKTLKMYDHQDVPFDEMIDELEVERELGKNPIFQTLFVVQNAHIETIKDENAEWNLDILDSDTSKFDFITQVLEVDNKLSVKFEYDTSLFYEETIQRWSEHFKSLELILRMIINKQLEITKF